MAPPCLSAAYLFPCLHAYLLSVWVFGCITAYLPTCLSNLLAVSKYVRVSGFSSASQPDCLSGPGCLLASLSVWSLGCYCCLSGSQAAYQLLCLHIFLDLWLLTCLPACLSGYMTAYLPVCMFLVVCLPTFMPAYFHACLPTCLSLWISDSLLACLFVSDCFACLLVCLPSCMPVCLSVLQT
jgi:hypothetical protein